MRVIDQKVIDAVSSFTMPVGIGVIYNHHYLREIVSRDKDAVRNSLRHLVLKGYVSLDGSGGYEMVDTSCGKGGAS